MTVLDAKKLPEAPDLSFVRLAADAGPAGKEGVSDWFTILRTGSWPYKGDTIHVTQSDLDQAVTNFKKFGELEIELPVDYDHSFALAGNSEAAGWYHDMRRDGDRLQARVKWLDEAQQKIDARRYRYFSAEYHETYSHPDLPGVGGFTILSGGLTNRPAVKGMGAVALSEKAAESIRDHAVELGEAAGFDMVATPRSEQRSEMPEGKDKGEAEKVEVELVDAADAKPGDHVKLDEGQVIMSESDVKTLRDQAEAAKPKEGEESEVKTLAETVTTLRTELTDERFGRIFSEAQRSGRVDAEDKTRESWRERADKWGLPEVEKLLNELPTYIPVDERGGSGDENPDASTTRSGDLDFDTPEGQAAIAEKAKKLMEDDDKITLSEALEQIEGEMREKAAR